MTDPGKFNYGCKVRWEMDSADWNISLAASSGHKQLWPSSFEWLTASQEPSVPQWAESSYSCYQKDQGLTGTAWLQDFNTAHTKTPQTLSETIPSLLKSLCKWAVCVHFLQCKASLNVNSHCCKPVWIQVTPAKHKARPKEGERLGGSGSSTWPWEAETGLPLLATRASGRFSSYRAESQISRAESIQEFPHKIPAWVMVLLLLPKQKLIFLNSSPLHLHLWIWRSLYLFLIKRIFISLVLYFRID